LQPQDEQRTCPSSDQGQNGLSHAWPIPVQGQNELSRAWLIPVQGQNELSRDLQHVLKSSLALVDQG
jgi:hypothetical protein